MSREKQIEEMAFNLIMATSPLGVKDLTKQFDYKTVATDLYELYGWRKASDVAEEIFAEIMQAIEKGVAESKEKVTNSAKDFAFREVLLHTGEVYAGDIGKDICEVFKKYTTEDGE